MTSAYEMRIQRRITAEFIADRPSIITLIPTTREIQPNRSYAEVAGTPRDPQTGRLIPLVGAGASVTEGDVGTVRTVDYQLLLPWDAVVAKGDTFTLAGDGYRVVEIEPDNGYETRAQVTRYLPRPTTVVAS